MAKAPAPATIQAEFSQDPETGEWIATSQTPRCSVRSMQIRQARDFLAAQLEAKLGKQVVLEEKVRVPKGLAEQVAEYQRQFKIKHDANEYLEKHFIPLVQALLRERLQHQQIAVLLGVSKQWLSQQLKQHATGAYRSPPRKD
jgi:hypothetical protein